MPLPEQKSGTVANIEIKIKEKVAQNCWPILAQFNWPATLNPHMILVLGIELGSNIPAIPNGIEICVIQHPSTGFSYKRWNGAFLEALERARSNG
jgi:hypothetical protein